MQKVQINESNAMLIGCLAMDPMRNEGDVLVSVNGTAITTGNAVFYVHMFRQLSGLSDDAAWVRWLEDSKITEDEVARDTLSYLVMFVLQRQMAEEHGVSIGWDLVEEEVDDAVKALGGELQLAEAVERLGVSRAEYRAGVRECMARNALIDMVAEGLPPITSGQVTRAVQDYRQGRGRRDRRPLAKIRASVERDLAWKRSREAYDAWLHERLEESDVKFCGDSDEG